MINVDFFKLTRTLTSDEWDLCLYVFYTDNRGLALVNSFTNTVNRLKEVGYEPQLVREGNQNLRKYGIVSSERIWNASEIIDYLTNGRDFGKKYLPDAIQEDDVVWAGVTAAIKSGK